MTLLGISIGIITIVTLGAIADGLDVSMDETLRGGSADFILAQQGLADLMLSSLTFKDVEGVKKMKEIKALAPLLWAVRPVGKNPLFIITGTRRKDLSMIGAKIRKGRVYRGENEILLGKMASENLKKKVGDKLIIDSKELEIVGIVETGVVWEDAGAFLPLEVVQKMEKKEDKVSMFYALLQEDADLEKVTDKIEKDFPSLTTVKSVSDWGKVDTGSKLIDAATWAISLLVVIIGGIGVMNTMIMSVYERTREIGTLRAVGWKKWRIVVMILGESLFIGFLAALVGSVAGIGVTKAVLMIPLARSMLEAKFSAALLGRAIVVALIVGFIGAIYPAYRASRLSPVEALRHE